jgi:hypothetical protein
VPFDQIKLPMNDSGRLADPRCGFARACPQFMNFPRHSKTSNEGATPAVVSTHAHIQRRHWPHREESNLISPKEFHWILRSAQNDKPFLGRAICLSKAKMLWPEVGLFFDDMP